MSFFGLFPSHVSSALVETLAGLATVIIMGAAGVILAGKRRGEREEPPPERHKALAEGAEAYEIIDITKRL